ncbi:hypothetical protein [Luteimonas saliphila]|uniref:hypothetical protein n=1 Tax=Luteimonas saliphila TaxID=2804919 RepID=UPI00192D7E39|nr:hypothetical protein [Luteimonas saliphila]
MDNVPGAGPCTPAEMRVVIGNMTEPELMAALEQVVMHWQQPWMLTGDYQGAVGRSVRWLHDKYGREARQALTGEAGGG